MFENRSSVFLIVLLFVNAFFHIQAEAQEALIVRLGGGYDSLNPEQKTLVNSWHAEYTTITGTKIDPKDGYDNLKPSVRTTFEAVTNALQMTALTDSSGKPLGNALSLVKLVESVHGEVPQTRGDEQFRIYVRLQDDALKKLYECTQFRRIADNGIYHTGYPINFRQQGGAPSIQFSVTRTGLRADIDVDYRSSGGPQALVNGHLTAANSDVRAGNNYSRHVHRWHGLGDWWRSLFGISRTIPKSDLAALNSAYRRPPIPASEPVQTAVNDFYMSWLVDKKPELSLSYVSVSANACIAAFSGQSARDNLIRLRLLQHMRHTSEQLGPVNNLGEVLQGSVVLGDGAVPVVQPEGKLFFVAQLTDTLARRIDCRKVYNLRLAEDLPYASDKMQSYFSSSSVIRSANRKTPGEFLYLVWHRESGVWKIVSWYLQNPLALNNGPQSADEETEEGGGPEVNPDPGLAPVTARFLKTWLVSRDIPAALRYVAPNVDTNLNKSAPLTEQKWFQRVAADMPKGTTLNDVIQPVDISHPQMRKVNHPNGDAYILVRISDDLSSMYDCKARKAGAKIGPGDAIGKAFYTLDDYQTAFQPRHKTGDRGTVVLTWARRQNRWMVVAFDVVTY